MGINGGLVRSVFSRHRSFGTYESNVRSNVTERRRWSSVRWYLCGDEYNSVMAENDSASVKSSVATTATQFNSVLAVADEESSSVGSSEATVTQPMPEDLSDKGNIGREATKEDVEVAKAGSAVSKTMSEEHAATIIQSAFRGFRTRCRNGGAKSKDGEQESPSRGSLGTSVEVQTGNSVEVYSIQGENSAAHHRAQQKAQALKLKEDWDDSTVSSNISKIRMQNRLEATRRRQRALAYAFSQQLRICSKKRHTTSDGTEQNMGWSWLERWMATRPTEISSAESHISDQVEQIHSSNQRFVIGKRLFDGAGEEKESCGSNEVGVLFDNFPVTPLERDGFSPTKNRFKTTRSLSRQKSMPSYVCGKEYPKVSKKDCSREADKDEERNRKRTERSKCRNSSF
ncbi:protein IQ-DOMAIN 33 [Pyrus x bretschneideri]|uniref:protein IQ-DOMAIN 33 n=1 Tax=Pyrus x bretschneideri TaxID=225117 RepID=UPI00202E1C71|nr:protein IQ-DOMAIN 33 [Pyrus x bretschneideri]XP_048434157.1 protein IQ-DOMAIN 33 [Pyrus x bretschneideri]XP_048434158.1 protein IQ-DOMAIN 33 [Pyrus x bretschneideri]